MRPRHPHPHPPPQMPPTTVHSATFRLTLALARRWRCIRCIRCCSALSEYHDGGRRAAGGAAGGGGRPAAVAHVRWPREGGRGRGREGARARGRQIWRTAGGRRAKRCKPHLRVACWRRMNLRRKLLSLSELAALIGDCTSRRRRHRCDERRWQLWWSYKHVRCGDATSRLGRRTCAALQLASHTS